MDSILKILFSFLWWIYNPHSATHHQILSLWKDVELWTFSPYCPLIIGYDLPASSISALKYGNDRTQIVTVSRMFLGPSFSLNQDKLLKIFLKNYVVVVQIIGEIE